MNDSKLSARGQIAARPRDGRGTIGIRKSSVGALAAALLLAAVPGMAFAYPTLQLGILDLSLGTDSVSYDPTTEDTLTTQNRFNVIALGDPSGDDKPNGADLTATTHTLSVAITPQLAPGETGFGTFDFSLDGGLTSTTIRVTEDMVFGTPPIEDLVPTGNPGDELPGHGIYDTYYIEIPITFTAAMQVAPFNVQDDGMGSFDLSLDGMYYSPVQFDTTALAEGIDLHFDLYHVREYTTRGRNGGTFVEIDYFAPFSHDAGTQRSPGDTTTPGNNTTTAVPVPGSLPLLALGAGLLAARRRRR